MKIRLYTLDGYYWHGVEINGRLILINRIAPVGACIRP